MRSLSIGTNTRPLAKSARCLLIVKVSSLSGACYQRRERRKLWDVPARVSQEEWDERASRVGIEWLESVRNRRTKTQARCLVCQYEWDVSPSSIQQGSGCPNCAGLAPVAREVWEQRYASRGLKPMSRIANGHTKVRTRCLVCDYEWDTWPSKVNQGVGCPNCAGKFVSQDEWHARYQKVGLELLEVVRTNINKVDTRCKKCGHEWKSLPNSVQQGRGCPECKRISDSEWVERAARVGIRWIDIPRNARTPSRAKCLECGRQWDARPSGINSGHGCEQCASKRQGESQRRPQEEWAACYAARRLRLLEPIQTKRIHALTQCLECDYTWKSYPQGIWNGPGCPSCAQYGFKPNEPGLLYLLQGTRDGALKIGITNTPLPGQQSSRLKKHQRNGWQVQRTWELATGQEVYDVEQAVVRWWREELGLPQARTRGDGFTETVSGDRMTVRRVIQYVNKAIKIASQV